MMNVYIYTYQYLYTFVHVCMYVFMVVAGSAVARPVQSLCVQSRLLRVEC